MRMFPQYKKLYVGDVLKESNGMQFFEMPKEE